jgi:hypothetical protein
VTVLLELIVTAGAVGTIRIDRDVAQAALRIRHSRRCGSGVNRRGDLCRDIAVSRRRRAGAGTGRLGVTGKQGSGGRGKH